MPTLREKPEALDRAGCDPGPRCEGPLPRCRCEWTGLRPTTPSNVPYVGSTPYRNLWLNTGHGTLGWTLGAGSGKRIVDMMMASQHTS